MYIRVQSFGGADPADSDSSRDVFLNVDILQCILAVSYGAAWRDNWKIMS